MPERPPRDLGRSAASASAVAVAALAEAPAAAAVPTGQLPRVRIRVRLTRHMRMLGLIILLMVIAAINYQSNAAWALVLALGSTIALSTLHARRNLACVSCAGSSCPPGFAGEEVVATVLLASDGSHEICDIAISIPEFNAASGHTPLVPARTRQAVSITLPGRRRGIYHARLLRLSTAFPFGLVEAWHEVPFEVVSVVYPRPSARLPALSPLHASAGSRDQQVSGAAPGSDDFLGHRRYQDGDPTRQIDWKAHARGVPLMIKRFAGAGGGVVWCDWQRTQGGIEDRLSQLARLIVDAHRSGQHFGLRLPHLVVAPDRGVPHYHGCLRTLAMQPATLDDAQAAP
jgi:uncharacterized protein (DUF58 family)